MNGVTTKYYLDGDKVILENTGTDSIYYSYDADDKLVSLTLNGTEYFYIRNGQGDITGLIDTTGTQVVSYTYDSWGKLISIDGSLKDTVGLKNPYRYRGYRYDTETGLYYLQSRYYNPDMGRYINADDVEFIGASGTLLSYNLFAYCENNPVNNSDPTGHLVYSFVSFTFQGGAIAGFFLTIQWVIDGFKNHGILITTGVSVMTPQVSITYSPLYCPKYRTIYNMAGAGWSFGGSFEYIASFGVDILLNSKGKFMGIQVNIGGGISIPFDAHASFTFSALIPITKRAVPTYNDMYRLARNTRLRRIRV